MCEGFFLGNSVAHTLSHSAVGDPLLSPLARNLARKRARHLAATSIKSPLSSLRDRSVFPVLLSRKLIPCIYILFRSVDLPHCCYLFIESQLGINPFMIIISDIHGLVRPKSHKFLLYLSHILVASSQDHKQKQHKETTVNSYKKIFPSQSHNLPFRVCNATPSHWVSINSRRNGICRFLSNVVLTAVPNTTNVLQKLQLQITIF